MLVSDTGCCVQKMMKHSKKKQGAPLNRTHPAIANKLLRIALLVKLAIKATDNSDMYNREFPGGNALFLFAGGVMSLLRLP